MGHGSGEIQATIDTPVSSAPRLGVDGDLLGIAQAWEQAGSWRKPPKLVEQGLLAVTPARSSLPSR